MKAKILAIAVSALALTASNVSAQVINGAATGLVAPAFTIDFNSSTPNVAPGTTNGVSFSAGFNVGDPGCGAATFTTRGVFNFSCAGGPIASPSSLLFATAVNGVAFNFITNSGTSTITAYLNNVVVGTFGASASTATPDLWYGFDNLSLDRLEVTAPGNLAMGMDNIQVNASVVPEPSTYALMFAGLASLGIVARRRKQR